jgi:hypothetical protein
MGYCMNLSDSDFFIPKSKKAAALKAIKALAGKETINMGGSGPHFSWVTTSEFVEAKTLGSAVRAWRWYVDEDDKGNVTGIGFNGEKLGDDNLLFDAISPFVRKGSFIQMRGEDDHMWRWVFDGKSMHEVSPTISWSED